MDKKVMNLSDYGLVYAKKNLKSFSYTYNQYSINILVDWPYFVKSMEEFGITPIVCHNITTVLGDYAKYSEDSNVWLRELVEAIGKFGIKLDVEYLSFDLRYQTNDVVTDVKSFGLYLYNHINQIDERNRIAKQQALEHERMINCRTRVEWDRLPKEMREQYEAPIIGFDDNGHFSFI